jgi:predicted HD superfamily hydrolase involved in NAD metabolism
MQKETSKFQERLEKAKQYSEEKLRGELLLEHTRGCAETARKLADRLGIDVEKAETASYLHDIAKIYSHKEQAVLAKKMGMPEAEVNSYPSAVLHGPLGALIAEKELGIHDPDILQAIKAHSTGCRNMCDVAKAVFVADYIERTRNFPGATELRNHRNITLNELTEAILKRKLEYLLERRKDIDPRALDLWNELMEEENRGES